MKATSSIWTAMNRTRLILAAPAALLITTSTARGDGQACLVPLEARIARQHPAVATLLPEQLEALKASGERPLVLDVREADEYAVSTIEGAIRIVPGIRTDQLLALLGDQIKDRPVVMACSVGVRSSLLADRAGAALKAAGAKGVYNLRGGLFAWHNTARPLQSRAGETDVVHPYSRRWSSYLDFPNFASYRPVK